MLNVCPKFIVPKVLLSADKCGVVLANEHRGAVEVVLEA